MGVRARSRRCEGGDISVPFARGKRKILRRARLAFVCAVLWVIPAYSQTPQPQQQQKDLTDQSLEDLMNIQVTSVSKKEQKLSRTAAAIFVISEEDIRRSGATNIPDLLRMVPGMDVGEINGSTWAVSARDSMRSSQ